ncbi:MAG: hypothetical protein QX192_05870 [Methylococcales bacterium]
MICSTSMPRFGDKQNSDFFEEYLQRLLTHRDASGLTDMIGGIEALMIGVEPGNSVEYITELVLMTPYQYLVTLDSEKHLTHVLRIDMNSPDILLREVKHAEHNDIFRSLNDLYPVGAKRPHSRYLGEILLTTNRHEVVALQQVREFRFFSIGQLADLNLPLKVSISKSSPYTQNGVGYMERPENAIRFYQHGNCVILHSAQAANDRGNEMQTRLGIWDLLCPIDHLATRVYSQNRQSAILEYLALSSYYFWGSYDIADQNSSTNVTKNTRLDPESKSPAKVFTANNHPYCVNHLDKMPSPTETFVRNYGPRMHHIAVEVKDGNQHIDVVVDAITAQGKGFLLNTVGSREEGLKQIFSSASDFSSLIIEYVQRFDDFDGFFTKENVASLTYAAGQEESVSKEL